MLVPVIGLIQVGSQPMADRYIYLPLIGVSIIVAWGVRELASRWSRGPVSAAAAGAAVAIVLAIGTRAQVSHWRSSLALWEHAILAVPGNYRAHTNLGHALEAEGRLDEAIAQDREALRIKPDYAEARNNLGSALMERGKPGEAIEHLREAVRLSPRYVTAHNNLGLALGATGHADEAIAHFTEAIRLNPLFAPAHGNLGVALAQQGRVDEAVTAFRDSVRLQPGAMEAHQNLARALTDRGRRELESGAAHRRPQRFRRRDRGARGLRRRVPRARPRPSRARPGGGGCEGADRRRAAGAQGRGLPLRRGGRPHSPQAHSGCAAHARGGAPRRSQPCGGSRGCAGAPEGRTVDTERTDVRSRLSCRPSRRPEGAGALSAPSRQRARRTAAVDLAPAPDLTAIETMIDSAFWASLRREEGRTPQISLAFVPPDQAGHPLMFETRLPLRPPALTKLAPAVERPGIHLGVWREDGELCVWGTTRTLPAFCFVVEVITSGQVVIKDRSEPFGKFVNVALLEGDQIKFIDEGQALEADCPGPIRSLLGFTQRQDGGAVNVLVQIATSIRAHGRGGALLVVPSGSNEWQESIVGPVLYAIQPPFRELADLVLMKPAPGDLAEWQEEMRRAIDAIAGLTAVDGATIMTDKYEVVAFGAKIRLRRENTTSSAS